MTNPTTANLVKLKEITYAHNDVITYLNVHLTLQNFLFTRLFKIFSQY